jgi:uncharacterized protein with LGFP repeats
MAALRWTGAAPDSIEIQAQHPDGHWGDWIELDALDTPDKGQPGQIRASEPAWLGDTTTLRVHAKRGGAPAGADALSVVLIDPGRSASDAAATGAGATSAQPAVISRAGWGADESIRTQCYQQQGIGVEYAATVKAASLHHTAGTNDYTAADSARLVRGIYAFHAIDRAWCDIGYNVLVDKYGQIFEGRFGGLDRPVIGAHTGGFNTYTVGVSMLGEFTAVAPSEQQLEAVSQFVAWKFSRGYRDPNATVTLISGGSTSKYPAGTPVTLPTIFGHRDVVITECPGDLGYPQLPTVRQRVTQLMGSWTASPVYQRWQATGADAGTLGGVFQLEADAASGGLRTTFAGDSKSVYWSSATGAHIVQGEIRNTWARYASEAGHLGYPITDESGVPDGVGRFNHFAGSNGSIYWSPTTGAHEIRGAIKDKWASLGWERSVLGYPITDEYAIPSGRRSDFQGGYITWDAGTGVATAHTY